MGYSELDFEYDEPYEDYGDDEPCGDPDCSYCYPQDEPEDDRCGDPSCSYCYPYEHEAVSSVDAYIEGQAAKLAASIADSVSDAYEQGHEDGYDQGYEEGYQQGVLDGGRDALALAEQANELGVDPKLLAVATLALDLNDKLDDWAPSVDEELALLREGFKVFYAQFVALTETVADIVQGHEQNFQEVTDVLEGVDKRLDAVEEELDL